MIERLKQYRIILASLSPRRQQLMSQLGLNVTFTGGDIDESYPPGMGHEEVAVYLARKKADHFAHLLDAPDTLLVTADTLVSIDGLILGKPAGPEEARQMLRTLSGRMHVVLTGVCIRGLDRESCFVAASDVHFKQLSEEEIGYYLENYRPYDKAGAYGAQEWIGYIAITRIDGSYFNVMGLPVQRLYEELTRFAG
jgi:septum formation protein